MHFVPHEADPGIVAWIYVALETLFERNANIQTQKNNIPDRTVEGAPASKAPKYEASFSSQRSTPAAGQSWYRQEPQGESRGANGLSGIPYTHP